MVEFIQGMNSLAGHAPAYLYLFGFAFPTRLGIFSSDLDDSAVTTATKTMPTNVWVLLKIPRWTIVPGGSSYDIPVYGVSIPTHKLPT